MSFPPVERVFVLAVHVKLSVMHLHPPSDGVGGRLLEACQFAFSAGHWDAWEFELYESIDTLLGDTFASSLFKF